MTTNSSSRPWAVALIPLYMGEHHDTRSLHCRFRRSQMWLRRHYIEMAACARAHGQPLQAAELFERIAGVESVLAVVYGQALVTHLRRRSRRAAAWDGSLPHPPDCPFCWPEPAATGGGPPQPPCALAETPDSRITP